VGLDGAEVLPHPPDDAVLQGIELMADPVQPQRCDPLLGGAAARVASRVSRMSRIPPEVAHEPGGTGEPRREGQGLPRRDQARCLEFCDPARAKKWTQSHREEERTVGRVAVRALVRVGRGSG